MKWVIIVIGMLIGAVAFGYYLLNSQYFLPFNEVGQYDWLNIAVMLSLILGVSSCVIFLLSIGLLSLFKKGLSTRGRLVASVKMALLCGVGLVAILTLNFFHVLDWIWGLGILAIAIILLFIILFPNDKEKENV